MDPTKEISASKFRAENYKLVNDIDDLKKRNLIQRKENHYQVKALALPYLETNFAKELIADIEALYAVLKAHYLKVQEAPMPVARLSQEANIPATRAMYALNMMLDLSLWSAGYATDLTTPEAYVLANERMLEFPDFMSMVLTVSNWNTPDTSSDWIAKPTTSGTSDVAFSISSLETSQTEKTYGFESLLHPAIYKSSLKQFKDGHLREAVMNSVTAVYDLIRDRTNLKLDGNALASQAFGLEKGLLILSELGTESGDNVQKGFMQIYQGIYTGIRNPKAHTLHHDLDALKAAQYLVMMSLLARRVDESKNRAGEGVP